MTVLADYDIRQRALTQGLVTPFHHRRVDGGLSWGLSSCGYDVRLAGGLTELDGTALPDMILPVGRMVLGATIERFNIPRDLCAHMRDKSSLIRRGLMLGNTVAEPGWQGFLTLELTNLSGAPMELFEGMPIGQFQFELLSRSVDTPYSGKYQYQEAGPQVARFEALVKR